MVDDYICAIVWTYSPQVMAIWLHSLGKRESPCQSSNWTSFRVWKLNSLLLFSKLYSILRLFFVHRRENQLSTHSGLIFIYLQVGGKPNCLHLDWSYFGCHFQFYPNHIWVCHTLDVIGCCYMLYFEILRSLMGYGFWVLLSVLRLGNCCWKEGMDMKGVYWGTWKGVLDLCYM